MPTAWFGAMVSPLSSSPIQFPAMTLLAVSI